MTASPQDLHNSPETTASASIGAQPYPELLTLAHTAKSRQSYLIRALECIRAQFNSPYAVLYSRQSSEVIQEEVHNGPTDPRFWRPAVQRFLTDSLSEGVARARLLSARDAQLKIALLSARINGGDGGMSGAVALVVQCGRSEARTLLQQLDTMCAVASSAARFVGRAAADAATPSSVAPQALARAAGISSPEELAFTLTNNLRNKLGCEQVALSLVTGRRVRILSISGLDNIPRRSPGVTQMRAAMEECLDVGAPILVQRERDMADDDAASGYRLHHQWHATVGNDAVASIPLHTDGKCTAILSLRRRDDDPFKPDQLDEVRSLIEPFAPALLLVQRAGRSLIRHVTDVGRGGLQALFGRGRLGVKITAAALAAFLAWFCFGTIDYEIVVPAHVAPAQQRHVAAPFDATLLTTTVIAGDLVRAGNVLCEFDQRDLILERQRLEADLAVLGREHTRALADDDPAEARLVAARQRLRQAELDIINLRIGQSVVRAPFDGVVITGDLRKDIGSAMTKGTPLFAVAPLRTWKLELDTPEHTTTDLQAGLSGYFAAQARPEETQSFTLERISPGAEVRDGANVYPAEASITVDGEWLRPGMEGIAKVEMGPRPVWWVATHSVMNYLRLNFWL